MYIGIWDTVKNCIHLPFTVQRAYFTVEILTVYVLVYSGNTLRMDTHIIPLIFITDKNRA